MHEQNSDSHSSTILNNEKCSTLVCQSTNAQPTHARTTTKRHQHRAPREGERRAETSRERDENDGLGYE